MPTYEYVCKSCGHEIEEFQSINDPPLERCPNCQTDNLVRVIGGGAGLIFRGTGFYLTDYKKTSTPPGGAKEDKPSGGDKPEGGKKESASEKKTDEKKK